MPDFSQILAKLAEFAPFLAVVAAAVLILTLIDRLLRRAEKMDREMFFRQIVMAALTGIAILAAILALPIDPDSPDTLTEDDPPTP